MRSHFFGRDSIFKAEPVEKDEESFLLFLSKSSGKGDIDGAGSGLVYPPLCWDNFSILVHTSIPDDNMKGEGWIYMGAVEMVKDDMAEFRIDRNVPL